MREVDLLTAHSTWKRLRSRSMPRIAQVLVAFSVCSWGCTALCAIRFRKGQSNCKGRYLTGYRLLAVSSHYT